MKMCVIGGDARYRELARQAKEKGYEITTTLSEAEIVVLGREVTPSNLQYAKDSRVFSSQHIDFFALEEFAVRNAVPSAEGGIYAAMTHSQITIHGSQCLVMGYGRIGRVLVKQLQGLGAHVSVMARKEKDRTWARNEGAKAIGLGDLREQLDRFRFVFNTIPYPLLDLSMLARAREDAILIDLSSPPFGMDLDGAKKLGLSAFRENGVPGRYSPETAAAILLEVIEQNL